MPRFSLATRIFAASVGILFVVLASALFFTQRSAQRAAEISLRKGLESADQRARAQLSVEAGVLVSKLKAYAESPEYRANFEAQKEYLDYTQTAVEQTDALWVQVVGRDGVRLAKSDEPTAAPDTLVGSALISGALDGDQKTAFGVMKDSVLVQLASTPIGGGPAKLRIVGALMAARAVSDSSAELAGAQTESQVLYYALGGEDNDMPHATSGTVDAKKFTKELLEFAMETNATGELDSTATKQVLLGDGHYVLRRSMLYRANGAPAGGIVTMRSVDDQLKAAGFTNIRKTLLLVGGIGLLLALIASAVTANQIVRPVTTLADATRRAAEGDYAAVIPEGGRDEIGTLASSFRRLLADLKDKQALVDFLGVSVSGARTQALAAAAAGQEPTMKISAAVANMTMLSPGKMLGTRYEIKSVLGVGGMGMVYKANDKELGEVLAIKTLKPEMLSSDPAALERFKSEIKLARKIAHRNVVRTYDLGEVSGLYYISMEYVEGKSLKELIIERGRLPVSIVLPIAKQLCRALEVSHDEGVIHRDIKPQNMVVQSDGVLKVMDFGIARLATRPKGSGQTEAGMVVGTPEYMAPEQLLGDELDARADLYSTGAVLYECLTGRVPITADSAIVLISRVLEEVPKAPSEVYPDIPKPLSDLVMWVLQKDREKRPANALALHKLLDELAIA
jgi:HAMP domain-containing protein/predicted Ser/Thr protein kinase